MNSAVVLARLLMLISLLTACAGSSPKTTFYTLRATTGANTLPAAVDRSRQSIGIGPVNLADPLSRPQIVIRNRQGNLQAAEFHRWSGTLADNLASVLADEVATLLETSQVFAYPWVSGLTPAVQVRINVQQFEGSLGGQATLRVDWLLVRANGQRLGVVHRSLLKEAVQGKRYADLVEALEKTVHLLAGEIALTLRNLPGEL